MIFALQKHRTHRNFPADAVFFGFAFRKYHLFIWNRALFIQVGNRSIDQNRCRILGS